jgi:hypothetical protein
MPRYYLTPFTRRLRARAVVCDQQVIAFICSVGYQEIQQASSEAQLFPLAPN